MLLDNELRTLFYFHSHLFLFAKHGEYQKSGKNILNNYAHELENKLREGHEVRADAQFKRV